MSRVLILVALIALAACPVFAQEQPRSGSTPGPLAESGTMAMASLGLLALGFTLRQRRGR